MIDRINFYFIIWKYWNYTKTYFHDSESSRQKMVSKAFLIFITNYYNKPILSLLVFANGVLFHIW